MHLSFLHLFCSLIVGFFLTLNNIALYGCIKVYLCICLWKAIFVCIYILAIINKAAIKICVGFCNNINFQPKKHDCWIVWQENIYFCKNLPNCLTRWLHHFAFLPAINENSCCSTSSPAFGIASVLNFGYFIYFFFFFFFFKF